MALTTQTYDDLFGFLDVYWLHVNKLTDEIYDRWGDANMFDRIKYVTKMHSFVSRFSVFFYDWNLNNGWFLAQSVRFFKSDEELKKPEVSRHSKRYNMTYGERLEECFDDFHNQIGVIYTTDEENYMGYQIKLMLKMKAITSETIAIFDDIYMRHDWYDEGLEKHGERKGDGAKGSYAPAFFKKKPAFKP